MAVTLRKFAQWKAGMERWRGEGRHHCPASQARLTADFSECESCWLSHPSALQPLLPQPGNDTLLAAVRHLEQKHSRTLGSGPDATTCCCPWQCPPLPSGVTLAVRPAAGLRGPVSPPRGGWDEGQGCLWVARGAGWVKGALWWWSEPPYVWLLGMLTEKVR